MPAAKQGKQRRAELVVAGQVVVAFTGDGPATAEAVGIADGRVVAVGSREEVVAGAAKRARLVDARGAAVVPGLHDAHLHLVEMARARRKLLLDTVDRFDELVAVLASAANGPLIEGWLVGRGWHNAVLTGGDPRRLAAAVVSVPAYLTSHDGHSAWVSPAALSRAGIDAGTPDPAGGRIERDADGVATGVLREAATDLVEGRVGRLRGDALLPALQETLTELAGWGITGATHAGDCTTDGGGGPHAELGDTVSSCLELVGALDARLRLSLNIPAPAIAAAGALGIRTGAAVPGATTVRFGWAKAYADGALGSVTAALFDPDSCTGRRGILRLEPNALDSLFAAARPLGIGLAVHAIGDRANAVVLDAVAGAPPARKGAPADRIEHAQLVRAIDQSRFATLGLTISMQPIHAASDRDQADRCWDGRQPDAYAWRSLHATGARLAFGSDAPIESPNPWLGLFAAVNRHLPGDGREPWFSAQTITPAQALAAYTIGPALALGRDDEGHLRPGAHADLAVLNVDLATLLQADERLAEVRSELTLVDGGEVALP